MGNIMDMLIEDGRFQKFVQTLETAEMDKMLREKGPFTVFAPTDDAFSQLMAATLEKLLEDTDRLTEVLAYHIADGLSMADDLAQMPSIETREGKTLPITVNDDGTLIVDNAEIVKEDIECGNGVIQAIDLVLIPDISAT